MAAADRRADVASPCPFAPRLTTCAQHLRAERAERQLEARIREHDRVAARRASRSSPPRAGPSGRPSPRAGAIASLASASARMRIERKRERRLRRSRLAIPTRASSRKRCMSATVSFAISFTADSAPTSCARSACQLLLRRARARTVPRGPPRAPRPARPPRWSCAIVSLRSVLSSESSSSRASGLLHLGAERVGLHQRARLPPRNVSPSAVAGPPMSSSAAIVNVPSASSGSFSNFDPDQRRPGRGSTARRPRSRARPPRRPCPRRAPAPRSSRPRAAPGTPPGSRCGPIVAIGSPRHGLARWQSMFACAKTMRCIIVRAPM